MNDTFRLDRIKRREFVLLHIHILFMMCTRLVEANPQNPHYLAATDLFIDVLRLVFQTFMCPEPDTTVE